MANPVKDPLTGAETTGHVWDETLQEFNNPLPRWWLWTFYGTFIFALIYWTMYPSWPMFGSYLKGISSITYKTDKGEEVTRHWSTRALLAHDMQTSDSAIKQREYLAKVAATPYDQIAKDPDMSAFVRSYGQVVFGGNCAACHQSGAQGIVGKYPNLVDNNWLWGGDTADIETTIRGGRQGMMPTFKDRLSDEQRTQLANYVLSLSGEPSNAAAAAEGNKLFHGAGTCFTCHTNEATGMKAVGSANLTDKIWEIADVPAAKTPEAKLEAVKAVITNGSQRQMPSWQSRLSDAEIKVLVSYLQQKAGS